LGAIGWLVFGGTSVSAPIIASVYALAGNAGFLITEGWGLEFPPDRLDLAPDAR
jgi:hypothetical protein